MWQCFFIFYFFLSTGRHFCLRCIITAAEGKLPPSQRANILQRTLESLNADFQQFSAAGGDIVKAKTYNNVIARPLFDIPIDQVHT